MNSPDHFEEDLRKHLSRLGDEAPLGEKGVRNLFLVLFF